MLGTPIINPVAAKVKEIIMANERMGNVPHRAFSKVRNREVVVKTLEREGFIPDDTINPKLWRRVPKPQKHTPKKNEVGYKSLRKRIIDRLIEQGEFHRGEIEVDKSYLVSTISYMRKQGHEIKPVMIGRRLVGYELVA